MMTTTRRMAVVVAALLSACGGSPETRVTGLAISPNLTTVTAKLSAPVTVTATYSDGTSRDVTGEVAWATLDPAVASAASGAVTGVKAGATTLYASLGEVHAAAQVEVMDAVLISLRLVPPAQAVAAGQTAQVTVLGTYDNGDVVDVTAQVELTVQGAAQVQGAGAVKTAVQGLVRLLASLGGVPADPVDLQVGAPAIASLQITPAWTPKAHWAIAFLATATFTDGTSGEVTGQVDFTSGDDQVLRFYPEMGRDFALCLVAGTGTVVATDPATGVTATLQFDIAP